MLEKELCKYAVKAVQNAYAPYSGFKVGAALLTKSGKVYLGCNIENSTFSATNCAERTAFFKAISEGEKDFFAIAIAGGKDGIITNICSPCGVCRQVMTEFCHGDFIVLLVKEENEFEKYTLSQLLPLAFEL